MLYPQSNAYRQAVRLSDFWDFRFDPEDRGSGAGWQEGFEGGRPIAMPASWNDQFEEGRDYLGKAWYQTRFDLPWGWEGRRIILRFGSVNYLAEVWLNGRSLGRHEGGHLPFEFDITSAVKKEDNRLVVSVDGELAPARVPPGNIPHETTAESLMERYPSTGFDFFPYCGIHRPVWLYAVSPDAVSDITVTTRISGGKGVVEGSFRTYDGGEHAARVTVRGNGTDLTVAAAHGSSGGRDPDAAGGFELAVENAAFWEPESPFLYRLTLELERKGGVCDRYALPIGIRTVAVDGERLLLNGRPLFLKGFGRHEDFPVAGRGYFPPVIVKDFSLMKWVGANSFRTTHYPYSEPMIQLADRLGLLVIAETPAVGLYFRDSEANIQRRLELCTGFVRELIARDKNHPSVIAWSVANEPNTGAPERAMGAQRPSGKGTPPREFFRRLYDLAKQLDPTRPAALVSYPGTSEDCYDFFDLMCLNRYYGWYTYSGRIPEGLERLSKELDEFHERHAKPVILSEFGADTLAGCHTQPPEMFSEEYQAEVIAGCIRVSGEKPYVVGQHVWNFCDFKTSQSIHRVGGMNLKGVFTRDRQPKLAAHRLRELWT